MEKTHFILAAAPGTLPPSGAYAATIAHMSYRLGQSGHLFRTTSPSAMRGGLMVIDDVEFDGEGDPVTFCKEVLQECAGRRFSGAILQFAQEPTPPARSIVSQLGSFFSQRALTLYVPEAYAEASAQTKLLVSTALSGGSLRQRLTDAASQYGASRIALDVERVCADFFLPAPNGKDHPLTLEALQALQDTHQPSIFFSSELCSHYFTYMDSTSGAHFVMFDDLGSMQKKMRLASSLGISTMLFFYPEIAEWANALFSSQQ
jgi:hypothetical protein